VKITIDPVASTDDAADLFRIRRIVFEQEMGVALPRLGVSVDPNALHLLARLERGGEPIGALSVIETSEEHPLHESYGLRFDPGVRVARYTQLAVMKPYRGMSVPLMMVLEAHRRFVVPSHCDYTWLLFDAERAQSSFLCRWLGFRPGAAAFQSEYGRSRALLRDERAPLSKQAIGHAGRHIAQLRQVCAPSVQPFAYQAEGA
jgi:hypothetical protein